MTREDGTEVLTEQITTGISSEPVTQCNPLYQPEGSPSNQPPPPNYTQSDQPPPYSATPTAGASHETCIPQNAFVNLPRKGAGVVWENREVTRIKNMIKHDKIYLIFLSDNMLIISRKRLPWSRLATLKTFFNSLNFKFNICNNVHVNLKNELYLSTPGRDRHFTWSSEPPEGLAICNTNGVSSFLS